MARRPRIDSATAAVATLAAAARDLLPPRHLRLRRGDRPFWDAVVAERARSEWTDADLAVAANLARAMADAEAIAGMAVNAGGHVDLPMVVLGIGAADKLARRIVTLRRALGMDSRSQHGEQRDVNRRRGHAQKIEDGNNPLAADDEGLLARPSTIQ